jgi:hypothetical protein
MGALGMVFACALAYRPQAAQRSAWVAAAAAPLLFAGSLYIVPDGFGATSLPMAFALTALSSLLVLLISGAGRALRTGMIAACVFGGASAMGDVAVAPAAPNGGGAAGDRRRDRGLPGSARDDRALEATDSARADCG